MRILIADDDPVSRRLLQATLVKLGHDVVIVTNGNDAVDALDAPDGPRLAILDWMMPGADGLAVCRRMRQRAEPYVYVILLTARDGREDMMAAMDAEADDFLTKPLDAVELRARVRCAERVLTLQERLLQTQAALRHQATHDHLTGLWNRRRILDELDRELSRHGRDHRPVAVVMADIDHFKAINDTHGHAVGDVVLREVGERLRAGLRGYDCLGRYGGEEFLLVLPGSDDVSARGVAERARWAISSTPIAAEGVSLPVTVSMGVAASDDTPTDAAPLVARADEALYRAKTAGRNRVEG
jgi:diguanylate cyclase (GGDEF)-like protein